MNAKQIGAVAGFAAGAVSIFYILGMQEHINDLHRENDNLYGILARYVTVIEKEGVHLSEYDRLAIGYYIQDMEEAEQK